MNQTARCIGIILWIALVFPVSAQITITANDLPSADDTLRYTFATPIPSYDYASTGENHYWDFSQLDLQSQGLEEYKSVLSISLAMAVFFGYNSIGLKLTEDLPTDDFYLDIEDFYAIFNKNSQQYTQDGFFFIYEGIPIPLRYSSMDKVYALPLNYPDQDSTAFEGNQSLGDSVSLFRSGYRINEADGWGTIVTPYGEFDCLRVKTTLYEHDSLYYEAFPEPVVSQRTTVQYKWLAMHEKLPVLEANYFISEDQSETLFSVRYRDIYREPVETDPPIADFYATTLEANPHDTIAFYNTSTPDHEANTYSWSFLPDEVAFLHETHAQSIEPMVSFNLAGDYSVKLVAANEAGTDTLIREQYLQITDPANTIPSRLKAEQDPHVVIKDHGNLLLLQRLKGEVRVCVFDMQGRALINGKEIHSNQARVNISHLPSGSYVVRIQGQNDHFYYHTKIVKP